MQRHSTFARGSSSSAHLPERDEELDFLPRPTEDVASPSGVHVPGGVLRPGVFISRLAESVERRLSVPGSELGVQRRGRLAQFWYGGDSSVHYEVWLHEREGRMEIGLHCEADSARNRALYTAFDRHMLEVQAALGTSVWLEEWDRGWIRVYETLPLYPLDEPRVEEISARLAAIVAFLQPLYQSFAL